MRDLSDVREGMRASRGVRVTGDAEN